MKRLTVYCLLMLFGLFALAGCDSAATQDSSGGAVTTTKNDKSSFRLAPELHSEVWLNGAPTSLNELRGKVVLVDFWTFG